MDEQERLAAVDAICECFGQATKALRDGQECSMGCRGHVTHRCEKCGRYAAIGETTIFVDAPNNAAHKDQKG